MLYNIELKQEKTDMMCLECQHFDRQEKKCKGIGVACFEYDKLTQTCIDPITKLPFNPNKNDQGRCGLLYRAYACYFRQRGVWYN